MPDKQAVNQNISFYPTDLAIVEAIQLRNGSGLSGAVRFIIREWARMSGYNDGAATPAITKPTTPRPARTVRRPIRKTTRPSLEAIPGLRKGVQA